MKIAYNNGFINQTTKLKSNLCYKNLMPLTKDTVSFKSASKVTPPPRHYSIDERKEELEKLEERNLRARTDKIRKEILEADDARFERFLNRANDSNLELQEQLNAFDYIGLDDRDYEAALRFEPYLTDCCASAVVELVKQNPDDKQREGIDRVFKTYSGKMWFDDADSVTAFATLSEDEIKKADEILSARQDMNASAVLRLIKLEASKYQTALRLLSKGVFAQIFNAIKLDQEALDKFERLINKGMNEHHAIELAKVADDESVNYLEENLPDLIKKGYDETFGMLDKLKGVNQYKQYFRLCNKIESYSERLSGVYAANAEPERFEAIMEISEKYNVSFSNLKDASELSNERFGELVRLIEAGRIDAIQTYYTLEDESATRYVNLIENGASVKTAAEFCNNEIMYQMYLEGGSSILETFNSLFESTTWYHNPAEDVYES